MQRLRECIVWKYLAVYVAACMAVPYTVTVLPTTAMAQAQAVFGTSTVAVLPIRDSAGALGSVESEKATDAVALALEASKEFVVTAKQALQRELTAMGLVMPLSVLEQIRLADRLQVEKVLSGYVDRLAVNEATGQVRVRLVVELLDVATGEFLDGADVEVTTKAIPGWGGERNAVVNEGLRQAAEAAVAHILKSRTPVGVVTSVASDGRTSVNLGAVHGVQPGTELVVMRPVYQRDLGEVRLMKMGRIVVTDVLSDMCWATPMQEGRAKVGDRTYALHMNVARVEYVKRTRAVSSATKLLAALAALAGVAVVATGDYSAGPPEDVTARLYQAGPGQASYIRIHVPSRSIPLTDQVFAWLFYRREGQQNFPLSADNLVAHWPEAKLPNNVYDDDAATRVDLDFNEDYTYINGQGDEDTVTVDITYNHPPLLPGGTYYYRVQRVVEPPERAGSGAPVATTQVRPAQVFVPADINVNPVEALSEGSKPTNGVTYFTPVTLISPAAGASGESTSSIRFTWNTTLGANEYVLQVFPADDPNGLRNPDYQVTERRDTSGTMSQTITATFEPGARYYWRVGARRAGEAEPQMGNQVGWLFSEMRTLTTAIAPPPIPSSAGRGGVHGGASRLPRYGH